MKSLITGPIIFPQPSHPRLHVQHGVGDECSWGIHLSQQSIRWQFPQIPLRYKNFRKKFGNSKYK